LGLIYDGEPKKKTIKCQGRNKKILNRRMTLTVVLWKSQIPETKRPQSKTWGQEDEK